MRGVDANLLVYAVVLPMFLCGARPVEEDVAPGMLEVELALSRKAESSAQVGLIQDSDDPTTATDELVARDRFHLKALRGSRGRGVTWWRRRWVRVW